jgi:DNA invertase Pin-like site-specific DNA recombinase
MMDVRYLRISFAPEAKGTTGAIRTRLAELNSSLTGQRRECAAIESADGAVDVTEFVDYDRSAAKGKPREQYKALIAAIERGEVARIYVLHQSRLWRNRRERAEGIEILRRHRVQVVAAKGPRLDMSTAAGRSVAALLGEIDTMESELKGERLEVWHATRAERGQHAPGPAPYGWRLKSTGVLNPRGLPVRELVRVPEQAARLSDWYQRLHAGESLLSLARDADTSPVTLARWLTKPVQAGLRVRDGVEYPLLDSAGQPVGGIVTRDMWVATVQFFADRRTADRRREPQRHTHLLTGLAVCQQCDRTVRSGGHDVSGHVIYRCVPNVGEQGGVGRGCGRSWRKELLDEFIDAVARERLRLDDVAGLLVRSRANEDQADLIAEAAGIRARMSGLATDAVLRGVDVSAAVAAGKARLAEIDRLTGTDAVDPVLGALARSRRPDKTYEALEDVGRRQAVIRRLFDVRLLAPPRGRWPGFGGDEDERAAWYLGQCVDIQWRSQHAAGGNVVAGPGFEPATSARSHRGQALRARPAKSKA